MRKINTAKPANKPAKAASVSAKPAIVKAAAVNMPQATLAVAIVPAATEAAKPAAHIVRTAATVNRQRTNYAELSDRDNAYFAFYKRLILADKAKQTTVAGIVATGQRPAYNGSNKPHDAGAIVRLVKAGLIAIADNGNTLTLTTLGATRA